MSMLLEPQVEVVETKPAPKTRFTLPQVRLVWGWQHLALAAILILSGVLGFWNLAINGYSNDFYASAVKSMLLNWHNFFFASFDPGGFVTVDKPPLAFWIQTVSAFIFGFNGVSLLLPEALAGVLGVALLYFMVKQAFGTAAGLISALVLALTPIFVVMNRDNNPDSLMVFFLILAAWAFLKAAETGRLRWLLLGSLLVGLDFNIKTLAAIIALPAFFLVYLAVARTTWRKRIVHLVLATLVVLTISFSWAVAVDLTPANQRPYVGGSTNNSELNLIFGYNGLGRVEGENNIGGNNANRQNNPPQPPSGQNGQPNFGPAQIGRGGFGGGGAFGGGQPGALRLFNSQQAGEFGWFLPLALLSIVFMAIQSVFGLVKGNERRQRFQALIVWGGWLLLYGGVFSMAEGIFHNYYLVALAPAQAALAGIGLVLMWRSYRQGGWLAWFLPVSLAATAFFQAFLLNGFGNWNTWLAPIMVVLGIVALVGLGLGLTARKGVGGQRWSFGVVGVAILGLLIIPTILSFRTLTTAITGAMPSATPNGGNNFGPGFGGNNNSNDVLNFVKGNLGGQIYLLVGLVVLAAVVWLTARWWRGRHLFTLRRVTAIALVAFLLSSSLWWVQAGQAQAKTTPSNRAFGGFGGPGNVQVNSPLLNYLEANRAGYTYLVAVSNDMSAAPYIIETGLPVMSLGGFSGSDKILTVAQLQQLIKNHAVRYFLTGGGGGPGGGNSGLTQWVTQQCQAVSSSQWTTSTATNGQAAPTGPNDGRRGGGFGGQAGSVYDCSQI